LPETAQPSAPAREEGDRATSGFLSKVPTLVAGIAVLVPIGVTVWIIKLISIDLLDQPARRMLAVLVRVLTPDFSWKKTLIDEVQGMFGVGILLTLVFIIVAGLVAKSFFGRQALRLTEYAVNKVPLVRSVYNGIKQLSDAVFTNAGTDSFNRAVLVKFMGEDAYAVGFVTGETRGEAQQVTPERVMNVFVPTTPNPTSGYLLMVPADRLINLQMTVEEALKMVISGGIVTPPSPAQVLKTRPPAGEPNETGRQGDQHGS